MRKKTLTTVNTTAPATGNSPTTAPSATAAAAANNNNNRKLNARDAAEKKVTLMVVYMIGAYLVAWTPYSIMALIETFYDYSSPRSESVFSAAMATIPSLFAKTSCVTNPLVYGLLNPLFRSACLKLWQQSTFFQNHFKWINNLFNGRDGGGGGRRRRRNNRSAADGAAQDGADDDQNADDENETLTLRNRNVRNQDNNGADNTGGDDPNGSGGTGDDAVSGLNAVTTGAMTESRGFYLTITDYTVAANDDQCPVPSPNGEKGSAYSSNVCVISPSTTQDTAASVDSVVIQKNAAPSIEEDKESASNASVAMVVSVSIEAIPHPHPPVL